MGFNRLARYRFYLYYFKLIGVMNVGYSALGVVAWSSYLSQSQAKELTLRPPGAINEKDFVSTCMRCGMCVEACPYDVLKLSTISDDISMGTPYFTPRVEACRLCSDIVREWV
jgi:ferredoxin-type protein NapG